MRWDIIFPVGIVIFLLILVGFAAYHSEESFNNDYEFYSEWCPKLGAEIVEPVEGYVWDRQCYKESNGTVVMYFITKLNGKYYLHESK